MSNEEILYAYVCPACDEKFNSEIKDGYEECAFCGEALELVNGVQAYMVQDEDEDDDDDIRDPYDEEETYRNDEGD